MFFTNFRIFYDDDEARQTLGEFHKAITDRQLHFSTVFANFVVWLLASLALGIARFVCNKPQLLWLSQDGQVFRSNPPPKKNYTFLIFIKSVLRRHKSGWFEKL